VSSTITRIGLPEASRRERFWKPMSSMAPSPPITSIGGQRANSSSSNLLPVEGLEEGLVRLGVVRPVEQLLGAAHVDEAVRHLAHLPLEDADRDGGRVLEEVVDPGERVRVERIGAPPDRRAAGAVGDADRFARPRPLGPST
jgi:hypothetical protein